MRKVHRKPGTSFQKSCPTGVAQNALTSCLMQVVITYMKCHLPGKLIRDSGFGWQSRRQPLPGMNQNSRFPEWEQVFSIKYIAWTNSLGTLSHSYQEMEETLQIKVSRDQPLDSCKQAFLRIEVSDQLCSFLHFLWAGGDTKRQRRVILFHCLSSNFKQLCKWLLTDVVKDKMKANYYLFSKIILLFFYTLYIDLFHVHVFS